VVRWWEGGRTREKISSRHVPIKTKGVAQHDKFDMTAPPAFATPTSKEKKKKKTTKIKRDNNKIKVRFLSFFLSFNLFFFVFI
jgi:hypothetical protein